jgi:WD40 repeat protein
MRATDGAGRASARRLVIRSTLLWVLGASIGHLAGAAEPTSRPLPQLEAGMHGARINRIATDAAGRWAVTVSHDKTARIWDVTTGSLVRVLRPPQDEGNEGQLNAVAISPDGETIAVGGHTGWTWDRQVAIYLFDRGSGRLQQRVQGLSAIIQGLGYSPDGRWLAATLRNGELGLFDARGGYARASRDSDCKTDSHSVQFGADSQCLLTSCFDGQLRVYSVAADGRLAPPLRGRPGGGEQPYAARFSPGGDLIAVGFRDSTIVQVLDAQTLGERARPPTEGVDNGSLQGVAWSVDGRSLVAGGRWGVRGKRVARRWTVGDWERFTDLPLSREALMEFAALPGGGWLFAAIDPAWGVLSNSGQVQFRKDGLMAALLGPGRLRLADDARRVRFSVHWPQEAGRSFDLARLSLGPDTPGLAAARTVAPGLELRDWQNRFDPKLNGQPLKLIPFDLAESVAIAPDGQRFVVGATWSINTFDRQGRLLWRRHAPDVAYAVNISADNRFVVAGYGDGTIRWHRIADGGEVLALFVHSDGQRWVAWTPEGYYAASGPDAEEWMGYHLNRGKDHEGDFVSTRQLRERFYQPGLISQRLDADGDAAMAAAVAKLGDVRTLLAGAQASPPQVELLSPAIVETDGEIPVKVKVSDQGGGIGRLIYRIDGVEIEGRPVDIGVAADGTASRLFPLAPGRHREIAVSATNAQGVESKPVRILAEVKPRQAAAPVLHVLAVGITRYRDRELQRGVRFAAADAKAIGDLFGQQGEKLFSKVNVRLLIDEQATGDGIRSALLDVAKRAAAQDVFVLYLAGHGASFERQYHFVPWDAVYTSNAALRERSLTQEQFRELLAKVAATRTVVLLDTCSAAGFGREDGRDVGEKDAMDRLSRLSGRAMIAATADDKTAFEGEGGHGAFTSTLLQGLRGAADRDNNRTVEVRELADFVEEALPKVTRKWGYEQFPFSFTEGQSFPLVRSQ